MSDMTGVSDVELASVHYVTWMGKVEYVMFQCKDKDMALLWARIRTEKIQFKKASEEIKAFVFMSLVGESIKGLVN